MMKLMAVVMVLALSGSVTPPTMAAQSPSAKYADSVLDAMRGMVDELRTYSLMAEWAAPSVEREGALWLAGDQGFVLEGLGRAGGLMMARQMGKEPPPAAPAEAESFSRRPCILYGAFAPGPGPQANTTRELDREQEDAVQALTLGRRVFTITPYEINPCGHGVDLADVRPPVNLEPVEGLSLAAPVVSAHLWTFTAELVGELIRRGKMPSMYQSVLVPGGRERNAAHLKQMWEPQAVPPVREGLLGREYLAKVANALRSLKVSQAGRFAAAGKLAAETEGAGHTVWYCSLGHLMPELPDIAGDPKLTRPLRMNEPDKLGDFVKSGDLILYVGYYEPYGPWVEKAHELGARIVTVVSGTPERAAEQMGADINIKACWPFGDAVVTVPGYDIKILPASGVVQAAAYYMLLAEYAAAR